MKKNLFFVFTMLCALSFFTACSDDDDNKTDDGWKAISATYTAETLKLTMGGTEVADQSVKVDASSAEQATITLANLIPGEAEVKIEAKMVKTGESYALEGSNTNDLRTVSAKGTVGAGVLTLDATLKITAPIAGTWKLAEIAKDESETFVSGPVSMVWEAAEGTMLGFLPVTSIPNIAEGFGSIALVQVLQSVTFQEDGQIVASISKAGVDLSKLVTPVWETSEPGYASYNVTDKQILVFLDITKIMGSLKSKAAIDPLEQIMALLQNGIPVNYEIASDGKSARVYIDKALVSQIAPLLPTLAELIGDDALNGMGQLVKSILKAFPEAMEKTTKFEVGLKLIKQFIKFKGKEDASRLCILFFCMLGMSLYPVFLLTPDAGPSTFLKTVQMG